MRTFSLQMQVSLDEFVAGPNGESEWMERNWDDDLKNHVAKLAGAGWQYSAWWKSRRRIYTLLVRCRPKSNQSRISVSQKNECSSKIVFSKTLKKSPWPNTKIVDGNLVDN